MQVLQSSVIISFVCLLFVCHCNLEFNQIIQGEYVMFCEALS